jgi:hypothetical protein
MHRSANIKFGKNKWHGYQSGERSVRRENMNKMRAGAEPFDQQQRELNCAQRWRGKINRHKNATDLQHFPICLASLMAFP